MASLFILLIATGLGGILEQPPQDLASLLEPKTVLVQMNQDTTEDALIKVLSENGLTTVAKAKLKQAAENLGAESFKDRRRAKRLLEVAGKAGIPYLEEAAESDDPEKRIAAQDILKKIRAEQRHVMALGEQSYVKKLMAIRMLEQEKSQKAIPALNALLTHEKITLADAAARAILTIQGNESTRSDVKNIMGDMIQRIPEGTACAGLLDMSTGARPLTLMSMINELKKDPASKPLMAMGGIGGISRLSGEVQKAVGVTGNIRIDAVGVFASPDLGTTPDSGYLGFVFKGLCEPEMFDKAVAGEFRKSYKLNLHTVYYTNDLAICRLDKGTVIIAVGDRNDGHQIDPLVTAFSGKMEAVSPELLAKRHPVIMPGLQPVLTGDARMSIAGALSDKQRAVAATELKRNIDRTKQNVANGNIRDQTSLAMMSVAQTLVKAKSYSGTIRAGKPLELAVTYGVEKDAAELKASLLAADQTVRDRLKEEVAGQGRRIPPQLKEMFGDLNTPYLTVDQQKEVVNITLSLKNIGFLMGM